MKRLSQCHDIAKELDRLANRTDDEVFEHGGRLFLDAINAGCFDSSGDPDFKAVVERVKRDRLRPDDAWKQVQWWFELIGFNRTRYPLDAPASDFKSLPTIELLCARLAEIIEQAETTVFASLTEAGSATANEVLSDREVEVDLIVRSAGPLTGKEIHNRTGIDLKVLQNHVLPALKRKRGLVNKRSRGYLYPP